MVISWAGANYIAMNDKLILSLITLKRLLYKSSVIKENKN